MDHKFFVMLNMEDGYTPLADDWGLTRFSTEEAASDAAKEHRLGKVFGFEVFEMRDGQLSIEDRLQWNANEMARQSAEIKRLRDWVNDLQSGMYINCVYCGHRYQYGSADLILPTMAQLLKNHIEVCPEHPLSQYREVVEAAKVHVKTDNKEDAIRAYQILEQAVRNLT